MVFDGDSEPSVVHKILIYNHACKDRWTLDRLRTGCIWEARRGIKIDSSVLSYVPVSADFLTDNLILFSRSSNTC